MYAKLQHTYVYINTGQVERTHTYVYINTGQVERMHTYVYINTTQVGRIIGSASKHSPSKTEG